MYLKKIFAIFVLLKLSVPSCLAQTTNRPSGCYLNFHRLIGLRDRYVWACQCINNSALSDATNGRVEINARPQSKEMRAQTRATARCIRHSYASTLAVCERNVTEYQTVAKRTLRRCKNAKPTMAELRRNGPFIYKKNMCVANSYRAEFPLRGVVWVCQCQQEPFIFVSPGRAAFLTDAAPGNALAEATVIDRCTLSVTKQLSDVCSRTPGDFQLLALQLLEACCKRARVRFASAKLKCAAVVPKNVDIFKRPFLNR